MKNLKAFLFIIAMMNTIERSGIYKVPESILVELLTNGTVAVLKADHNWRVGDFAATDRGPKQERAVAISEEAMLDFVYLLVGQSVLHVSMQEEPVYELADHVREGLRTVHARKEMGLEEPIVLVGCHPARKWAHKEFKLRKKS